MIKMEPSTCNCDPLAENYDRWYNTAEGAMNDRLEKQAVSELLFKNTNGEKLLDVGCGTGHWSQFFGEQGFTVTGVDISPEMIRVAEGKNINRASFKIADALWETKSIYNCICAVYKMFVISGTSF
ncbi:class I SAM-dependent DNA methyltransferase [Candidatus Omnitrophota bacterium]